MDESQLQQRLVELQRKLLVLRWDIDELNQQMRNIEAKTMVVVAEARDDRGSPLYSTQEVRRAAVRARLAEDEEYVNLRDQRRQLEREADLLKLDAGEIRAQLPPEWPPRF